MLNPTRLAIATLVVALLLSATALAAPPQPTFPLQGFLSDAQDNPIDGLLDVRFRLYNAEGAIVFQELVEIQVSQGAFVHHLGSVEEIDPALLEGRSVLELGVKVGTDEEMAPRAQLGSVFFAAFADRADHAYHADHAAAADHAQTADHAATADYAQTAETVDGAIIIYRVSSRHCEEPPGTLSFSNRCYANQYDIDSCPTCTGLQPIPRRNCEGKCFCAPAVLCLEDVCPPRFNAPRCDNQPVGRLVPLEP